MAAAAFVAPVIDFAHPAAPATAAALGRALREGGVAVLDVAAATVGGRRVADDVAAALTAATALFDGSPLGAAALSLCAADSPDSVGYWMRANPAAGTTLHQFLVKAPPAPGVPFPWPLYPPELETAVRHSYAALCALGAAAVGAVMSDVPAAATAGGAMPGGASVLFLRSVVSAAGGDDGPVSAGGGGGGGATAAAVAAHTDTGLVTLLPLTPAVAGLEVRLPDGQWAPVALPPGAVAAGNDSGTALGDECGGSARFLLCFVGEELAGAAAAAGVAAPATVHRVTAPAAPRRVSMPFQYRTLQPRSTMMRATMLAFA